MASPPPQSEKLRVLLIPFFATSHIGPFTDLAFHLAAASPGVVEATVAVTPANVPVVRSALARRRGHAAVEVATYAFPPVDGLPPGWRTTPPPGPRTRGASKPPPSTSG